MKRFIILLTLFFPFCFSCEKDDYESEKHCWYCYIIENNTGEVIAARGFCDLTVRQLDTLSFKNEPGRSYRICYRVRRDDFN